MTGDGTHHQFRLPRRPDRRPRRRRRSRAAWKRRCSPATPQGERQVNYRLRDWGISRQRYWGCPIPVIHCAGLRHRAGAATATCRSTLPEDVTFDRPGNPLDRHPTWKHVACPNCGGAARRARPTPWTPSSIRPGISPASPRRMRTTPTDRAAADHWLPVDQYIGGVEHAILHLLYSRFFTRAMRDDRPSRPRRALRRPVHAGHGRPRDLSPTPTAMGQARPRCGSSRTTASATRRRARAPASAVEIGPIEKMSKSKRNTVDPTDIIDELRRRHRALVHAVRFAARARRDLDRGRRRGRPPLRAARLAAGRRGRRWRRACRRPASRAQRCSATTALALRRHGHRTLDAVASDIEGLRFNVAVAQHLRAGQRRCCGAAATASPGGPATALGWALREALELLVQMIAPMMPHLAEECWKALGHKRLVAEPRLAGGRAGAAGGRHDHCCRCRSTARSAPN